MRKVLEVFRQKQLPIVHMVRIYRRDGSNVDLCRRDAVEKGEAILLEGSPGCELADELFQPAKTGLDTDLLLSGGIQTVSDNESIIYKSRWGAFYDTPLESRLIYELFSNSSFGVQGGGRHVS